MGSSLGNSESAERAENDSDGLPPKRSKMDRDKDDGASFRLLADSIEKFSEIYEKIENNKRRQLLELEKMRINFHRELELQKRQILERARAEIAKLRQVVTEGGINRRSKRRGVMRVLSEKASRESTGSLKCPEFVLYL
ncbi:unnamed protein product [Thlaspi arvense]|uniref:Uncharacterized protein n=1 Tax=Thlaspi arvense TaxID=13288 RepID=A0AAU9TAG3_THLAR|nr:unnamed protein product [Thlaspi arvense]